MIFTQRMASHEDTLAHYGVKGMRWGEYKYPWYDPDYVPKHRRKGRASSVAVTKDPERKAYDEAVEKARKHGNEIVDEAIRKGKLTEADREEYVNETVANEVGSFNQFTAESMARKDAEIVLAPYREQLSEVDFNESVEEMVRNTMSDYTEENAEKWIADFKDILAKNLEEYGKTQKKQEPEKPKKKALTPAMRELASKVPRNQLPDDWDI